MAALVWTRHVKPRAEGETLHGRVLQVARARPHAPALSFGERTLADGELAGRAEALAAGLQARGLGPGSLVALHIERGFDMVTAVLGVLLAGAAYLPLDVAAPPLQLDRLMAEAQPDLLLTEAREPPQAGWRGPVPELAVGEVWGTSPAAITERAAAGPDDLAYVIFTSGSTGRPKGVEITHRAILNLLDAARRSPGFGPGDTLLAVASLAFEVSGVDLSRPRTTGGRLVRASREEQRDFNRLSALLPASGCTFMQATPTTWQGLVETGWTGGRRLKILSGADVLKPCLARALLQRGREVWNMYGPTEATVWCAQHRVGPAEDPTPIGEPVRGMRIQVAGLDGSEAALGEEGELLISGPGLSRGYRRSPELTEARFGRLPGPSGQRVYRSGALGRRRRDGALEWTGRLDAQVKIRGYRIELGDVEAALASHPGVTAVVVNAGAGTDGSASLTAYVVPRDPVAPPTAGELRRWVRERRPIYFVPQRIAVVDEMPRTAGGKIDWARLRALAEPG